MAEEAAIQEHFSPNAPLEPDVLTDLRSTADLHGLSAEDLFYKWESYCIRLEADASVVTLPAVRGFKRSTLDELEKSNQAKAEQKRIAATPRGVKGKGGDVYNMWATLSPFRSELV